MEPDNLKNQLAEMLFGMTPSDAIKQGICVSCKKPADSITMAEVDEIEYRISGLCKTCFEEFAGEEE
jgi:hypothetical protein